MKVSNEKPALFTKCEPPASETYEFLLLGGRQPESPLALDQSCATLPLIAVPVPPALHALWIVAIARAILLLSVRGSHARLGPQRG